MLTKIFDDDGSEIGEIELSDKQARVLEAGEDIVMIYHTPQTLRHVLGAQNGNFMLHKAGQQVIAKDAVSLKRYVDMQRAIKAARGRP